MLMRTPGPEDKLPDFPAIRIAPKKKRFKVNKDRRAHIVRVVTSILAGGEPTRFAFEATCRHAVRSRLCLNGWSWAAADDLAADVVKDALRRLGARRPTWKEGQPEWAQDGFAPILRTRCIRCHRTLEGERWKFCSELCDQSHRALIYRIRDAEQLAAYDIVAKGVTSLTSARGPNAI
ncbi:hypothetical protein NB311A_05083 [Nitrobacter sp. Nb-311A]|uniref:hypothetical protein n=1 Tax=Nitrobacter sp. Nb-311A TaxID=314253 RepID=UPI0000687056|nr:hypothetical protein [Nitrobacter sp. Nb-311A]EAQ35763.1 hypothetical protein NB311A_05083 [Nitrobacter sp. Nb-311A]